jgi:WD40 repeat protein
VAFSPDGRWLLAGTFLYEMEQMGENAEWINLGEQTGDPVSQAVFSANGRWLATPCHWDQNPNRLYLWDLDSPDILRWGVRLLVHRGKVVHLAFSPDSRQLLTAAEYDSRIRTWHVDVEELIDAAHRRAGRTFTEEERKTYFLGSATPDSAGP